MILLFLCLASFSTIISRSIHVVANGIISFFSIALYLSSCMDLLLQFPISPSLWWLENLKNLSKPLMCRMKPFPWSSQSLPPSLPWFLQFI